MGLEKFGHILERRHDYAREWKRKTGGKVIGYLCTYVPEEILYAGGALAVRILGGHESPLISASHIASFYCPPCRDMLAQGLLGRYDYLDGLVNARSCLQIRQTFLSWVRHVPVSYSHYINMTVLSGNENGTIYYTKQLREFLRTWEEWLGQSLGVDSLQRAIKVHNRNRHLLREIYELRKDSAPPISGAEAFRMVLAGLVMDKEEHNHLLAEALEELRLKKAPKNNGIRLMLTGSEFDHVEVVALIESLGARVVVDDLCNGSRYFWNEAVEGPDPLEAIAARYLTKPPCPLKAYDLQPRLDYIANLARGYRVQGAIFLMQRFCDPHSFDMPRTQQLFTELGIPNLVLDCDVTNPTGQYRTRIEAFIETLQGVGVD